MLKKIVVGLFAIGMMAGIAAESRAQGPFEFQFGYSLGFQNSFRNRLPAPPYFSVFPPVYYGQRYERPYGESPYASWPLLQPNEDYRPTRAANRVPPPPPSVIENPYVIDEYRGVNKTEEAAVESADVENTAATPPEPKVILPLVVVNPFVQDLYASK